MWDMVGSTWYELMRLKEWFSVGGSVIYGEA